jgi:DNA-binding transcriptional MerR regulator
VTEKAEGAFRTIGEVSAELGVPQHILRYWETRFPQLRPLQRAGNRRYYRAADLALVRRIDRLLNREGYTVRGVQQLLERDAEAPAAAPVVAPAPVSTDPVPRALASGQRAELQAIRDTLALALTDDTRTTM